MNCKQGRFWALPWSRQSSCQTLEERLPSSGKITPSGPHGQAKMRKLLAKAPTNSGKSVHRLPVVFVLSQTMSSDIMYLVIDWLSWCETAFGRNGNMDFAAAPGGIQH